VSTGINATDQFHGVGRGHVLAWRRDLGLRAPIGATICRKLAVL
jgi:hypothetical protein